KGPDLLTVDLTQNPMSGSGPKAGRNTLDPVTQCAAVGCEQGQGLHLEWKDPQVSNEEDKIFAARLLAMLRNLRWCPTHRKRTAENLREILKIMLIPHVRESMKKWERKRREIELAKEGEQMRDLLDEMIDERRPTVHESAKHLRGLFTAFMRGRGKEK